MANQTIGSYGAPLDLNIRQGGTFGPFQFSMRNPDASPVDLTGCTIRATMKRNPSDVTYAGVFTVDITDAAAGAYEMTMSAAQTAVIKAGATLAAPQSLYVWDMELIDSQSRVIPLYYGSVFVFREVTTQ